MHSKSKHSLRVNSVLFALVRKHTQMLALCTDYVNNII